MSSRVFNSLVKSLEEAGGILRGEITDHCSYVVSQTTPGSANALAVYFGKDPDLIEGKIYDVRVLSTGSFVARDQNGEAVICDKKDFLIIQFQPKAERLLRELMAA